ncbi:MAG: 3-phosphoshikimate 1-carboxyvinyltransferase [Candidatus Omnitrophica bacterium]|nr:3-phosphoshikimate 1-carboxyvinyltransferase [Candidatus Omnitrophota bacterium]
MNPALSTEARSFKLRKSGVRPFVVKPILHLEGEISLPGDKSIAHRAIILSAITRSLTKIENFPTNKDCLSTLQAFRRLGIKITREYRKTSRGPAVTIAVNGGGLLGLSKPKRSITVGDSGTTLRLLSGVLAGQNFETKLIAGESLSHRPMLRVTLPLRLMGAKISAKRGMRYAVRHTPYSVLGTRYSVPEEYPPITIHGGKLKAITYKMPVASAQVKSAILLAGLYAKGKTRIVEPVPTRDHTERLLKLFKADIKIKENTIVIKGNRELVSPKKIRIPGDISSAAFFIVLATIIPNSKVVIKNINLNPSRTGIIKVLKRMGARIQVSGARCQVPGIEPSGDITVSSSKLKGVIVKREEIPSLIDELPILMVAAASAKGKTIFKGVGELRVKETDRIRSMFANLRKMGSSITVLKDGRSEDIVIQGVAKLKGARVSSFQDHRTAMSMIVAASGASGKTQIDDISCINKSFPNFIRLLKSLVT